MTVWSDLVNDADWNTGPALHIHAAAASNPGRLTVTRSDGRLLQYENESSNNSHVFADCFPHHGAFELPGYLKQHFYWADKYKPIVTPGFDRDGILPLRDITSDALTGLYFSWKFLLLTASNNPAIPYPPHLTNRMVLDMSCHLFASMSWHEQQYGLNEQMSELHMKGSVEFARYLLIKNQRGEHDWYLRFLAYKRQASDGFVWVWVDEAVVPLALLPLSSEHTSQLHADQAYDKYVVRGGLQNRYPALAI